MSSISPKLSRSFFPQSTSSSALFSDSTTTSSLQSSSTIESTTQQGLTDFFKNSSPFSSLDTYEEPEIERVKPSSCAEMYKKIFRPKNNNNINCFFFSFFWRGGENSLTIFINFKEKQITEKFEDLFKKSSFYQERAPYLSGDLWSGYDILCPKDELKKREIIKIIHYFSPLDRKTITIIENDINIKLNLFMLSDILSENQSPATAISNAKIIEKNYNLELIWELANYYNDNGNLQNAYDCYNEISEVNPYYSEANEKMIYILLQAEAQEQIENQQIKSIDEEDIRIKRVENLFTHAVRSLKHNPDNQRLVNLYYGRLLGLNLEESLPFQVKGEIETLIPLAKMYRETRLTLQQSLALQTSKGVKIENEH